MSASTPKRAQVGHRSVRPENRTLITVGVIGLPVADGQETSLSPHDHPSPAQNRWITPHRGDVFEGNRSSRNSRLPRGFGTLILGRVLGRFCRLFQGIQAVSERTPDKERNQDGEPLALSMSACYGKGNLIFDPTASRHIGPALGRRTAGR